MNVLQSTSSPRSGALPQLAEPRFGALSAKAGHYESYYLKAGDPEGRRAVWIRYTVHKRPGREPEGSIWLTLFERGGGRPRAVKQTAAPGALATGPDLYVGIGDIGRFSPLQASGRIEGEGRQAAWELSIDGAENPLLHLPERLYRGPLPRTKLLTLAPAALFSGWVDFGGERVDLTGWQGMIGHNWGAQHAEQWVWLHGTAFEGHGSDTWVDLAMGRVKLGPWTTPWVANGAVSVDGVRHRLGGLGGVRATKVDARAGRCQFSLPSDEMTALGTIISEPQATVAWIYSDPDGSQHHTLNCSVSTLEITLDHHDGTKTPTILTTTGGAVYEFGSRQTDHGIPVEPFGDG